MAKSTTKKTVKASVKPAKVKPAKAPGKIKEVVNNVKDKILQFRTAKEAEAHLRAEKFSVDTTRTKAGFYVYLKFTGKKATLEATVQRGKEGFEVNIKKLN